MSSKRLPNEAVSRKLSSILRHNAVKHGLTVRSDGCVPVKSLLALPQMKNVTLEQLKEVVSTNNKQRYSFDSTGDYIRANQGHSHQVAQFIEDDEIAEIITEPLPVCVHGTYRKVADIILSEGLKVMGRDYIHLASGLAGTVVSGMRASSEVLIYIDMAQAMADGIVFRRSLNGVIETRGDNGVLAPKYFNKVVFVEREDRAAGSLAWKNVASQSDTQPDDQV
jgi:2'-phosphotransferase